MKHSSSKLKSLAVFTCTEKEQTRCFSEFSTNNESEIFLHFVRVNSASESDYSLVIFIWCHQQLPPCFWMGFLSVNVLMVHSVLQRLQLSLHLSWKISSDLLSEVSPQLFCLLLPERRRHVKESTHIHLPIQTFSVDGAIYWQPADNALLGCFVLSLPAASLEDPLQDAGVFTKARPQEGSGCWVLSEPVDVEDLGQLSGSFSGLHAQPVGEVVTKVVTKEGSHGKGVMHDHLSWSEK